MLDKSATIGIAIVVGVALELGVGLLTGRREAWDSGAYWTVGLPFAAVAALAIGCLSRRRNWFWAILIVPAQATTMMVKSGEVSGLWPLAMVFAAVLSLPFVAVAWIGARLSPWRVPEPPATSRPADGSPPAA
jgi:hypothetical protein